MTINLDETGTLTESNEKYFIVGSFTVGDPRRISRAFRKWQKSKFPKKLKGQAEVKFNNTSLTDALRLKTLEFLAEQDLRIFYTYLKKRNIPVEYLKKGKVHETGLLYTEIVGATLELYMPFTRSELSIIRDRRTLKGVDVSKFDEMVTARLLPFLPAKALLRIQAVDSTSNVNVQVADWICGALARYHEEKRMGNEFYEALQKNIVQSKELFSEKWTKLQK